MTARTNEATHVLNNTDDVNASLFAEPNFFANVSECDVLWGGNNDSAINIRLEVSSNREVFVGGTRRCVHDKPVEAFLTPVDVAEELFDDAVLAGPAPHHSLVCVVKQKPHRNCCEVV